ncbi:MAG: 30S ribosomal protein S4 [Armatimonadetes bacterium]|nr:30S ribosomal protein S4 [Armatimonadota bacterium]NIM23656.1 30S ribosomal protein S4 [Armatimonadota bacterium]NIM67526.1 30S ribosomal protein S4 [Armatimonadota bacterium]NIM76048.1 30S ribosomal protein S4 [Armatimonadota bacterium]NIN05712.1 30S ribosomal protein S4 [Armatimonadota bacterium]
MGRFCEPMCRICRREGAKLFLKGERCYTPKCAFERRTYPPGQHGQARRRKISDYGAQLREKQKLRHTYRLSERQFHRIFEQASKMKGVTGEAFLTLLERRLDNIVFRLGLASSRNQARIQVSHGHFQVNGRWVNIPSYLVKAGDVISIAPKSRQKPAIQHALSMGRPVPAWLQWDPDSFSGRVINLPSRGEIDTQVAEQLVVEYYSR